MDLVKKLARLIKRYNAAYRVGKPEITDKGYDRLVAELHRLSPNHPWFQHIEPVKTSQRRKVKLPIPMKSLDKVKDIEAFKTWGNSVGLHSNDLVVITPKFDGLSLLHDEIHGKAYSRGGADNEGQDCTEHYQAANGIFNTDSKLRFTYGEFVFSCKSWEENFANKKHPKTGKPYKSPRNTAAGLLSCNEPSENLRYVDFFRYGTDDESLEDFNTYEQLYQYLCDTFHQPKLYHLATLEEVTNELLQTLFQEWRTRYYIDGLVIYINEISIWKKVGRQETTGNPYYAIAYKNPNFTNIFETTVQSVAWRINKSWALKPTVKTDAVNTGDCLMDNPTGYNARWIYKNHIAKGARILVTRSGGVIPRILNTLQNAPEEEENIQWENLRHCPYCQAPTKWDEKHIELLCTNSECCGAQFAKIAFFFKTLKIDNIQEETLSKIYNAGYKKIRQILALTFEELIEIDGIGATIANDILKGFHTIKKGVEITLLMHASDCFAGIGQARSRNILSQLSEYHRSLFYNGMLHTWSSNEELQTMDVYTHGKAMLKAFLWGIIPFWDFVAENELTVLPAQFTIISSDGKCNGMAICFSGIRSVELEKAIMDNGGKIDNNVIKSTTHLIVADKRSQSRKAYRAHTYNIPIMTIDEFKEKYDL